MDKFSTRALKVLDDAVEVAHQHYSTTLELEHLMIACLSQKSGSAIDIIYKLERYPEQLAKLIRDATTKGNVETYSGGRVPRSQNVVEVIRMAARTTEKYCHSGIRTDHLLLETLRHEDNVPAQILTNQGVKLIEVEYLVSKNPD